MVAAWITILPAKNPHRAGSSLAGSSAEHCVTPADAHATDVAVGLPFLSALDHASTRGQVTLTREGTAPARDATAGSVILAENGEAAGEPNLNEGARLGRKTRLRALS